MATKPRITLRGKWWVCKLDNDLMHHAGYGSTPRAAYIDWRFRGATGN